jgi:hypothetical protein
MKRGRFLRNGVCYRGEDGTPASWKNRTYHKRIAKIEAEAKYRRRRAASRFIYWKSDYLWPVLVAIFLGLEAGWSLTSWQFWLIMLAIAVMTWPLIWLRHRIVRKD